MIGVRLGRPHILRSVTPRAATASLPLLVALLLAGGQARAAESPPGKGQTPAGPVAQAGADPFAGPADATPPAGATPVTPAPGATPASPAPAATPAPADTPGATPSPPAARDDRPGKPSLGPAPTPSASTEPRVLISEVVIEGLADHPERERLELAAYAAMAVTPGNAITRSELETDLQAIYATGWFSDVRIQPQDGPLGVRLVVSVVPNPVLTKVSLDPADAKVPETVVQDTFASDYGKTLNLVTLQGRMQELQKWYADQGFSLARVTGPSRIGPDGDVQLLVRQGTVKGVEVQFLNKEGSATNDKGQPIKGKTKEWVITREISIKTGEIFNRRNLEDDLKRLYGTGLFSDVKVTLRPEPEDPGSVVIVLGVVEQSTGSLSGGLGYSQSQGVFGQIQVQDSNLFGRAWDLSTSFTYGQFGGLADISFSDPWIKGDKYRTAFRFKAFVSRDAPQVFQSQNNGNFFTVSDFYQAPGTQVAYNIFSPFNPLLDVFPSVTAARIAAETSGQNLSWFQFDGNSVLIQRVGANVQFVRPLNGGNPFKRAPWTVLLGLTGQVATPMDFSGTSRRFALATPNEATSLLAAPTSSFICLAYNCAARNQLVGLRLAATMSTLNDPRNPTKGNFLSIGTEQFFSVGPDSPTFNRIRGSFTHYIPVRWLKFYKGCRPKAGETEDCKQALAFQVSAGTVIGDLPPYEAFCLGGGNSVRGYFDCDLGVGRSFGEATIEYRFPLFSIVSGELFIDGGTTFGSQTKVPGNLGGLLNKPGSGFSIGTGLIVTTPVGPLRLEVASQDFTGEWRFNLGVGWKF
ncbi:BamA/TamA family outer membrane protein [Cyanobium sp. N.Huapi 1H5]|uniref:BamA/TamA family outer membrane protein n=1 Tax=Cyanobium sp. N.Huapi 1H5 TaxID=2823719 RepID=UPI0020CE42BD|nr:BamA/TamA family outer membrane protein [Cyanobium sp. N.Huapi 1H5]MCP9838118.1 BamA/TamA family outer membrane protein [Cyanobium sp. N.Huapi 1H5]